LLFVPVGLSLFYHFPISKSIFEMSVLPGLCLVVLAVITGVAAFRRSPHISFALFWFAVTMLPVSNIIPMNAVVANRWLYASSIGFCVLIAWCTTHLPREGELRKILTASAVVAVALCYMLLSVGRNNDWRNPMSLWSKTIKSCPTSFVAHNNLGVEYMRRSRMPEAIDEFTRAVRLNPDLVEAQMNLARCYERTGKTDLAIKHYNDALASPLSDYPAQSHFELGRCLERSGRIRQAIKHYEAAVNEKPDFAHAHLRLAAVYKTTDIEQAIEHSEKAVALMPANASACCQLSLLYHQQVDIPKAAEVLRKNLTLNPHNETVRDLLAQIERDAYPKPDSY
jgi:tetratricopeptide (TPR) repeat protein